MTVLNDAAAVYVGDVLAEAVYLGTTRVWFREEPSTEWGPGERMLDPAVIPSTTYSGDYTTAVRFTVVADGRITHLCNRNYDTSGNARFRLYDDASGTLLVEMPVPVFYGQQDVPLPTPVLVQAGKTYLLTFYAKWPDGTSYPATSYPYQDGTPVSMSPNLINMTGTYAAGDGYPTGDGGQYYWLDVLYQKAGGIDPDTQRFLDATGLPGYFATALDGLVVGLKGKGLWAKMNAVYPFIGGTADFHKWNLMDPRDTDDAFRLTYVEGTGSHSTELGYKPNAAYDSGGGYADTHLIPAGLLDPASAHLSAFSLSPLANGNRCDFGAYNWDGTTNRFHLIVHYMSGEFYYSLGHTGMNNTPAGDGSGLFTSSRTSMSEETAYLNGVAIASNQTAGGVLPPVPLFIGCLNGFIDEFSDLPFGFVSIGSGLDAQNVADLNAVVQEYRLAVSTAHWTPKSIPGMLAWIDPAQDTFVEGETVNLYREHSGAGLTFTPGGNFGPIFRASPPRLEFNGQNQGLYTDPVVNAGLDGLTFVGVSNLSAGNYPMLWVLGPEADGYELRYDGWAAQAVVAYTTQGIVFAHPTSQSEDRNYLNVMRLTSGVRSELIVDGVLHQDRGPAGMHNVQENLWLGRRQSGFFYYGTISEALVFAGPVSDADLALLTDYLATKHNLYAL